MDQPYRAERSALLERREALQAAMGAKSADADADAAPRLKRRLKLFDAALAGRADEVVDSLTVATPCGERWDRMTGSASERVCARCTRSVYDLSEMTRDEIVTLIAFNDDAPCIRLRRRADGRVVTRDCPPRARRRVPTRWVAGALIATAVAAAMYALRPREVRSMGIAASTTEIQSLRGGTR